MDPLDHRLWKAESCVPALVAGSIPLNFYDPGLTTEKSTDCVWAQTPQLSDLLHGEMALERRRMKVSPTIVAGLFRFETIPDHQMRSPEAISGVVFGRRANLEQTFSSALEYPAPPVHRRLLGRAF